MDRTVWGYCRVSSVDQNLDRQKAAMLAEGIDEKHILCDKASGKDRLGRNYTEIRKQWAYITTEIGADIKVLDMPLLDTSTATENLDKRFIADLVLQILSYTAEKERTNIRKRQAQGIEVARAHGVKMGRPTKDYPENWQTVYIKWKQNQILAVDAMRELNLTKPTFYRLVKRYEGKD